MIISKNNVHVSGNVLGERYLKNNTVQITVGIQNEKFSLPINVLAPAETWKKFKAEFPENSDSVTISGKLLTKRSQVDGALKYLIKANSITCFHNILQDSLDESETAFHGLVRLKKKIKFDNNSNLYLNRMVFEIVDNDLIKQPVIFEARALRGAAPYFDNIQEGEELVLRANYVKDRSDNPPYWKIKHRPEQVC